MKRKLLYLLLALMVIGCSSKIVYGPSGVISASNYSIQETMDQNGKVISRVMTPLVPTRWYDNIVSEIAPYVAPILKLFGVPQLGGLASMPVSSPASAPAQPIAPAPVLTPYPAPTRN